MNLEVLMSVMHQTDMSIGHRSKVGTDLLIINQCDSEDYSEQIVDGHLWRMISTTERGAARSRNMAIRYAHGDICLLADDDEVFKSGFVEEIINSFSVLPDAAAIVYNVERINNQLKKKYHVITQVKESPYYRGYGNVQMAFRLDVIKAHSIVFNEKFGSGTEWGGGEDTLFQIDMRRKGLKIYEYPSCVATIDYSTDSQWFHGYDEKFFYNAGAYHGYVNGGKLRLSSIMYAFYFCFFKLRREKLLGPFTKITWMYRGFKGIEKDVTYRQYLDQH